MSAVCETIVSNCAGVEFARVWVTDLAEDGTHSLPIALSACDWIVTLSVEEANAKGKQLIESARACERSICNLGGWFRYCSRVEASGLGLALMNAAVVANRLIGQRAAA